MKWVKANWKAILAAIATAVGSLAADHTVAHRISDQVVKVLPLVPDSPPGNP